MCILHTLGDTHHTQKVRYNSPKLQQMKNRQSKLGHRAQRTGFYANDKFTNWTDFDPFGSEIDYQYFDKYWETLFSVSDNYVIKSEKLNENFILPITSQEIEETLNRIPQEFLVDLKGILLLSGSKKQLNAYRSDLFRFGTYAYQTIFLFPFPKEQLITKSKRLPAPNIRREYERAGATYTFKDNSWQREFDHNSLKNFYLKDVLLHEVGHHVDRNSTNKNYKQAERYAEWFATEYGFKKAFDK